MPDVFDLAISDLLTAAISIASFALGAWLGSWFPDVDQKIRFLRHRSIVTHGFLLPVLLLVGVGATRLERVDWFIAGFAAGVSVHLAFDLFPEGWRGYALISAPIFGTLSKTASMIWLAASVFLCLSISVVLARGQVGLVTYGAALLLLYLYGVVSQKERIAGPLLTLIAFGWGAASWTLVTDGRYIRDLLPL